MLPNHKQVQGNLISYYVPKIKNEYESGRIVTWVSFFALIWKYHQDNGSLCHNLNCVVSSLYLETDFL